jgi:predicted permease
MTKAQAEAAIAATLQGIAPVAGGETRRVSLVSIRELQTAPGRPMAVAFFVGALLALALVAINLVLLLLARASTRAQEVATRAALGASRWRIARLFLVDSVAYSAVGTGGGLLLGWWFAMSFAEALPARGNDAANLGLIAVTFDARVVAFTLVMGVIVALFGGVGPAWRSARVSLTAATRTQAASGTTLSGRLSKTILAAEVAVSTVVLIGVAYAGVGIWRYLNQPLGFELEDRFGIFFEATPGSAEQPADWPAVLDAVRRVPGVRSAAVFNPDLLRGAVVAGDLEIPRDVGLTAAFGADYFETWGVNLLAGRWPARVEVGANAPLAVVDEQFGRHVWPDSSPVGLTLRTADGVLRVVTGVVSHRRSSLAGESPGFAYIGKPLFEERERLVAWAPGLTAADLAQQVEVAVGVLAPGFGPVVYDVTFERLFMDDLPEVRLQRPILVVLGVFTIAVAGVGLFGLVAYLVQQRTRDFGIRLALGARPGDIWRDVTWQSAAPAMAGIGTGAFAAWTLQRVIEGTMFGWQSSGLAAVVAVSVALLIVAFIAAVGPARRVLRIDPSVALRTE